VLPHEHACSDFPASFLKGKHSCSACITWCDGGKRSI